MFSFPRWYIYIMFFNVSATFHKAHVSPTFTMIKFEIIEVNHTNPWTSLYMV